MTGVPAVVLTPILLIAGEKVFPSATMGWVGIGCILPRLLEPFFTAVFAFFIFSEQLSLTNWLAFFLVLTGICIVKSAGQIAEA